MVSSEYNENEREKRETFRKNQQRCMHEKYRNRESVKRKSEIERARSQR